MTGKGYETDVDALRRFGRDLETFQNTAGRLAERIGGADVTDTAWGVVGLVVKEIYSRVLGESQDYLGGMEQRITEVADLLIKSANEYQDTDVETKQRIAEILGDLEGGARRA